MSLRKADSEKSSKDHNIRSLQDELQQLDETIAKLNKEKKQQEEINKKLLEDLHGNEDKTGHANTHVVFKEHKGLLGLVWLSQHRGNLLVARRAKETVDGEFTTVDDVAPTALFSAAFVIT